MPKFLLFILLFSLSAFSQKTITGVVSDTLNQPLESANLIAKPLQEKAGIKFAMADNKGRFRLELDNEVKYEIVVSYIGYTEAILIVEPNSSSTTHNFKLKATGEKLKEIIIKHEFKPIIVKKDTMTYDVKSFANGNERKMKEVLEKLPGVEVDKNGDVTVQGKKVTKMLVEGKSFFGGGTKLAVENIPADALDKIEVIDNFNQVGFMKEVSGSEDLAMNVKLKEDKKKFIFGDIEAAAELGNGDNGFYLGHAALFYYSPKGNVSFIGDSNNIGRSTFTFQDLMRFDGGASSFLTGRKSLTNLYSFTNDNTDVVENKSHFGALNFSYTASPKMDISGFAIFSKVIMNQKLESNIEYLQNESLTFENRTTNAEDQTFLGIGNVKLDYSPNKKEKIYYNGQFQASNNDKVNLLKSTTNLNSSTFKTLQNADNTSVKQYVEWHKSINAKNTTTLVINQAFEETTPQNTWFTDQSFLPGLIPLQDDSSYTINQINTTKNNSIDALFKHYWIINNFNHLYTNAGNNYGKSQYITSDKQILTDGTINDFASAGFGNDVNYQLNDAYIGLEYKFKIGIWTNKPGLYFHWYDLKTQQLDADYKLSKTLFQPQFTSELEFNKSESLEFNYKLENDFPDVNELANKFRLQSYNSVYKGNALLRNERFHTASLNYRKMNMYRGIHWYARASFNKKVRTIRNDIVLQGINQFSTPIITENPETNWNFYGSFEKKIYHFKAGINTSLSWFTYTQSLNDIATKNDRNRQSIGVTLRTANRNWPDLEVGYTKGFSAFNGLTSSHYKTDAFNTSGSIEFLKNFVYKFSYENLKNTDNNNQTNFYEIANASLRYQEKNNPFGFELSVNNVFDNQQKNSFSFSDFNIINNFRYVMPRVILFSVSYKL
ncbi:carboxypeptidase-like regulatory domain-containing protein [Flavobacterium sp.]|uniref:TonB-dependent receptor n=1 Tax=Flavobacterium sp. TaxID=239 RepID=UPI0026220CF3|nr:carboxypeptidase-like regulatory domain-containing protein [Flavobacterium sp.]MDD3004687.1 carboxypeptidase-like regulatory domain-containing protein [Flavobacterium sp.]